MKTGRPDYDAQPDLGFIPENEPTFLLRAQDVAAADTLRAYAALAKAHGAAPEMIEQVLEHAVRFDAWPRKKVPDLRIAESPS